MHTLRTHILLAIAQKHVLCVDASNGLLAYGYKWRPGQSELS